VNVFREARSSEISVRLTSKGASPDPAVTTSETPGDVLLGLENTVCRTYSQGPPGGHAEGEDTSGAPTVEVTAGAEGIVSHTGARLLAELKTDGLGLTAALSEPMAAIRAIRGERPAHDPASSRAT